MTDSGTSGWRRRTRGPTYADRWAFRGQRTYSPNLDDVSVMRLPWGVPRR